MKPQEIDIFPGKSDQHLLEFINPSEITFDGEAAFVYLRVEMAFASPLDPFAIALVRGNIWPDTSVP